jgi:hypothetical protein
VEPARGPIISDDGLPTMTLSGVDRARLWRGLSFALVAFYGMQCRRSKQHG